MSHNQIMEKQKRVPVNFKKNSEVPRWVLTVMAGGGAESRKRIDVKTFSMKIVVFGEGRGKWRKWRETVVVSQLGSLIMIVGFLADGYGGWKAQRVKEGTWSRTGFHCHFLLNFFFLRLIMSTPYLSAYVNTAFVWGVFGKLEKVFSSKEIIDYYFF